MHPSRTNRILQQCRMSRLVLPTLHQLNDHAAVRIHQIRKNVLLRSISVGNKSDDEIWRGRIRSAKTSKANVDSHDHNANDMKSHQQQQPMTSSLLEEIAQIQRRAPMLVQQPSSDAANNSDVTNEKSSPLSFFRTSQQQKAERPQQQSSSNGGSSTDSLTKLLIETTGIGVSSYQRLNSTILRVPSNIPLRSESSIFDVFQVPEAPQIQVSQSTKRSPNAYPLEAVKQYYEILEPIITSKRFYKNGGISREQDKNSVLDWLKADEPVLLHDLPTFTAAIKGELDIPNQKVTARKNLHNELSVQNARFCKLYNLSDNKSPALAYKGLFVSASMCARYGKGLPVEVIWEKIKESGIYQKDLLQNLLYVSATFTTGSARSRRKRRSKYGHLAGIASILDVLDSDEFTTATDNEDVSDDGDLVDITDEIAIFHDLLFEPSEQSINIRVKLLVAQGKAKEAEMLLDEHALHGNAELRLRAYTPVLRLFIELNDFSSALHLFRKMKDIPTVHIDADAYMHIIAGMAEKGLFCIGAKPIENIHDFGYRSKSGPGLLDELVEEISSKLYEIPASSAKRFYNALVSGFPDSGLNETSVQYYLKTNVKQAESHEVLASRVFIDPVNGICPRSGVKLRLIGLSDDDKQNMVDNLLQKAKFEQRKQSELRSGLAAKKRDNHLLNFYNWLDQREGRPFTALIDGANVAYYHQNSENGQFSYHQIKFVVDFLESLGENPLVVLPSKYAYNNFNISVHAPGYYPGGKQFFSQEEINIRETLSCFGKIFYVPSGLLGK